MTTTYRTEIAARQDGWGGEGWYAVVDDSGPSALVNGPYRTYAHAQIGEALARHGFTLEGTGGNCTGYVRRFPNGEEELLTVAGEALAPESWDAPVDVGLWYSDEHGDDVPVRSFASLATFVRAMQGRGRVF